VAAPPRGDAGSPPNPDLVGCDDRGLFYCHPGHRPGIQFCAAKHKQYAAACSRMTCFWDDRGVLQGGQWPLPGGSNAAPQLRPLTVHWTVKPNRATIYTLLHYTALRWHKQSITSIPVGAAIGRPLSGLNPDNIKMQCSAATLTNAHIMTRQTAFFAKPSRSRG
jgi:hypothetical protein